jgi:hypothetical protein
MIKVFVQGDLRSLHLAARVALAQHLIQIFLRVPDGAADGAVVVRGNQPAQEKGAQYD